MRSSRWSIPFSILCALILSTAALAQEPAADPFAPPEPPPNPALLEGHVREGAFLSGPGSLTFVLHHTIMGAAAGLATQGISTGFNTDLGNRERMLAGTLIGAGLGFGVSAWWQFNHWIGTPMATYGIVNSVLAGMLTTGFTNQFTENAEALAWTAFLGVEAGAWLTAVLAGGDMPVSKGLLIASGGLWGLVYSALILGMVGGSGTKLTARGATDALFISAGIGGVAMAIASAKYNPSSAQILRADLFGLGVGGAVFIVSSLVVGLRFDLATPYVLAALSSAGAITAVSLLWEESAERPEDRAVGQSAQYFYRSKELDRPYRTVWW
ncbi:MAG: hypothetical protein IRZ16_00900 [Myxococcaceae bacterium]|nr:hypothetical protein [Myxococcaceae bacterium]